MCNKCENVTACSRTKIPFWRISFHQVTYIYFFILSLSSFSGLAKRLNIAKDIQEEIWKYTSPCYLKACHQFSPVFRKKITYYLYSRWSLYWVLQTFLYISIDHDPWSFIINQFYMYLYPHAELDRIIKNRFRFLYLMGITNK